MNSTTKFLIVGVLAGYVLAPMLSRVPLIKNIPQMG